MNKDQLEAELKQARQRIAELEANRKPDRSRKPAVPAAAASGPGQFDLLFATMEVGVVYQNARGAITQANPAAVRILGLTLDELQGRKSVDRRWRAIHEDGSEFPGRDHPAMVALRTGEPVRDVVMGVHAPREDAYRWILVNAVPEFRQGEEKPYRVFTTFTDITERKQTEEKLRRSEEQYRFLLDNTGDFIARFDRNGTLVFGTEASLRFSGYRPEEIINNSAFERVHPEDLEVARGELARVIETGGEGRVEYRLRCKSGEYIWVEAVVGRVFSPSGEPEVIIVQRDVTERKLAEERLRQSEAQYRLLAENMSDTVWLMDMNLKTVYISSSVVRLRGFTLDELNSIPLENQMTPDSLGRAMAVFAQALSPENLGSRDPRTTYTLELEFYKKDGTLFWSENTFSLILDEHGLPVNILGSGRDITERKRAERHLQELQEFSLATIDALSAHLCVLDEHGVVISVNQAWRDFGEANPPVPADHFLGANYLDICDHAHGDGSEGAAEVAEGIQAVMNGGLDHFQLEYPCHSAQDKRWFIVKVTRFTQNGVVRVAVAHENITERKQVEEKLFASETRFATIFRSSPNSIAVSRLSDGEMIDVNEAWEKTTGWSRQDVIGMNVLDLGLWADPSERERMKALMAEQGAVHGFEMQMRNRSGEIRNLLMSAEIVTLQDEPCMLTLALDISERKQAEAELRESEKRYRLMAENSSDVIWVMDPMAQKFIYVSPSVEKLRGYTPEEVMSQPVGAALTPESLARVTKGMQANLPIFLEQGQERATFTEEVDQPCKDGSIVHTEVTTTFYYNQQGAVEVLGVSRDISERRQAEQKLHESESSYHRVLDSLMEGCQIIGFDWRYLYVNNALAAQSRQTREELIGKTMPEVYPGIDATPMFKVLRDCMEGQVSTRFENQFTYPDGSQGWFELSVQPTEQGLLILSADITERKQAEDKLRESEALLKTVLGSAPITIFATDAEGRFTLSDGKGLEHVGLKPGENVGASALDLYAPLSFLERTGRTLTGKEVIERVLAGETVEAISQLRGVHFDNRIGPICDQAGRVIGMVGVATDITERSKAEEKLRDSEERLELVMEGSQLGYWDWDIESGQVHRNARWAEMLGYSLEEVQFTVKQWTDLHHPDDREAAWKSIQDHLDGKTPAHRIEYRLRAKDGQYKWILDQARVVKRDAQGRPLRMSGTHTDVTERKKAEEAAQSLSARQKAILAAVPDIIMEVNLDKLYIFANQAGIGFFGEDVVGKDAESYFVGEQETYARLEPLFEGSDETVDLESWQRRRDGQERLLAWHCRALKDSDGQVVGILSSAEDITERKRAELARQQYSEQLAAVVEVEHSLAASLQEKEICENLALGIGKMFPDITTVFISGYDADRRMIRALYGLHEGQPVDVDSLPEFPLAPDGRGLQSQVILSRQPSIVNGDLKRKLNPARTVRIGAAGPDSRSALYVPLLLQDQVLGLIQLQSLAADRFTEEDVRSLTLVANTAAVSFQNARLFETAQKEIAERQLAEKQIQRRVNDLEVLYESGLAFNNLMEPARIAEELLEIVGRRLAWHHAVVRSYDPLEDRLEILASRAPRKPGKSGNPLRKESGQVGKPGKGLSGWVLKTGRSVLCDDVRENEHYASTFPEVRSGVYVPLSIGERAIGSISVESTSLKAFDERDQRLLETIAAQAAIAIENAQLYLKVQKELDERREAEQALSQNERILRMFVEHSPAAIAMFDTQMRYLVASRRYLQDYNLPEQNLTGRSHYDVFPEMTDDRKEIHRRCLAGEIVRCEADPLPRQDGHVDWVRYELRPWYETTSKIGGLIFFSEVFTERRQKEEELRRSQADLAEAQRVAHLGSWRFTSSTKRVSWSEELYRIFELDEADFDGSYRSFLKRVHPGDRTRVKEANQKAGETGEAFEIEYRILAGADKVKYIHEVGYSVRADSGQVTGLFGIAQDVTENRMAQLELQATEKRWRAMIEESTDAIAMLAADGSILYESPAVERILGFKPDELLGRSVIDHVHADDQESASHDLARILANPGSPLVTQIRYLHKNGQTVWVEATNTNRLDDPALGAIVVNYRDITTRKQAEEQLRLSEQRLKSMLDTAMDAILTVDQSGRIVMFNAAAERMFGVPSALALGQTLDRFIPEGSRARHRGRLQKMTSESLKSYPPGRVIAIQGLRADGSVFPAESTFSLIEVAGDTLLTAILRDVTERKQAEDKLRESEARARAMLQAIPDLMFRLDREGVFLDYKADVSELHVQSEPILGKRNRDITPPQFSDLIDAAIARTLESGHICTFEYQLPVPGQGMQEYEARMTPSGPDEVIAIVRNITERKQAENLVTAQRDISQAISRTDSSASGWKLSLEIALRISGLESGGIYLFDHEEPVLNLVAVSGLSEKFVEQVRRFPLDSKNARFIMEGKTVQFAPEQIDQMNAELQEGLQSLVVVPIPHKGRVIGCLNVASHTRKEISTIALHTLEMVCLEIGNFVAFLQTEEELRESNERFRQLAETIDEVFWVADPSINRMTYVSPGYERIWGQSQESLYRQPHPLIEAIHPEDREPVMQVLARQMEGIPFSHEYRILRPDGSLCWVWDRGYPIRDEAGRLVRYVGVAQDITERKQAETELLKGRAWLHQALEASNAGTWEWNLQTGDNIWSEEIWPLYGLDHRLYDRPSYELWKRAVHPEDVETISAYVNACAKKEAEINSEYRVVHPDGSVHWLMTRGTPIWDSSGRAIRYIGTVIDITERKQNEELLRQRMEDLALINMLNVAVNQGADMSEIARIVSEEIRRIFICQDAAIYLLTPDRTRLALQRMTLPEPMRNGIETLIGRPLPPIEVPATGDFISRVLDSEKGLIVTDRQTIQDWMAEFISGGHFSAGAARAIRRMLPKFYRIINVHSIISIPLRSGEETIGILELSSESQSSAQDLQRLQNIRGQLTEIILRIRAQEASRRIEEQYRSLAESSEAMIAILDREGVYHYANALAGKIVGASPEEIIGKKLGDFSPPGTVDRQLELIHQALDSGERKIAEAPVTITEPERWFRTSIQPIREPDGSFQRVIVSSLDITEHKEMEHILAQRVAERTAEVQDLYDYAPCGYHSLDGEGRFTMINQTELNWLGRTREEVVGRRFIDYITPESVHVFEENFPIFKQRGWVHDLEFDLVRKDGSSFPVLVNATAIYEPSGKFIMSRSTLFDNTERKRAELALRESDRQNRLLFEEAPEALVLMDDRDRIVRANHAFETLTGYMAAEVMQKALPETGLITEKQYQALAALTLKLSRLEDANINHELRLQRADGEFRDVYARVFPVEIGNERHYLSTLRDVTAEKELQDKLRQANAEMERSLRMRDEFLANMSHELRTPLNAILGISESLAEQVAGPLNEKQLRYIHTVFESGQHLLALINDILDLSKLEAGKVVLEYAPVNLKTLSEASLRLVREQAHKKQIEVNLDLAPEPGSILADERRLKQMLVNLLSNAVKFTPQSGRIGLQVRPDADYEHLLLTVWDTGIGIAAQDRARLFQPFVQLDASLTREFSGTGLGLALVAEMARLHGGSVSLESEPGKGSRFTVTLPLLSQGPGSKREPGLSAATETVKPERSASAVTILLVEDTPATAMVIADYLETSGYRVLTARDGLEGVTIAGQERPDLILMDVQMPVMDGLEASRRIRAEAGLEKTPIIALTALAMPGDRERCLEAGMQGYMTKPVSLKELDEVVRQCVKGKRRQKDEKHHSDR